MSISNGFVRRAGKRVIPAVDFGDAMTPELAAFEADAREELGTCRDAKRQ